MGKAQTKLNQFYSEQWKKSLGSIKTTRASYPDQLTKNYLDSEVNWIFWKENQLRKGQMADFNNSERRRVEE